MPNMQLTPEEARHIMKRRRTEGRDAFFRAGLAAAAVLVTDRIPGAAGENLADEINGLKRPRNSKKGS